MVNTVIAALRRQAWVFRVRPYLRNQIRKKTKTKTYVGVTTKETKLQSLLY